MTNGEVYRVNEILDRLREARRNGKSTLKHKPPENEDYSETEETEPPILDEESLEHYLK